MVEFEKKKKEKIDSYLVFQLQGELFTINVGKILSILNMQKLTVVPESPKYMKGIINLRGKVIPVIDSHVKFNLEPINITIKTSILVLDIGLENKKKFKLGFMVDKVEEVIQIQDKKILPPPGIGDVFQSDYITGVYQKDENKFIMILDIEKALSLNEIVSLNTVILNEEISKKNVS